MKWIEWVEPLHDGSDDMFMFCRATEEAIIKAQKITAKKHNPNFIYESDEAALNDFMTEHWAYYINGV